MSVRLQRCGTYDLNGRKSIKSQAHFTRAKWSPWALSPYLLSRAEVHPSYLRVEGIFRPQPEFQVWFNLNIIAIVVLEYPDVVGLPRVDGEALPT
jgi:hypothetical protein